MTAPGEGGTQRRPRRGSGAQAALHHVAVTRRARYATLGALDDAAGELWLACHGYGQLAAGFLADLAVLESEGRLVVAPEALSRFYLEDGVGPHGPASRVGATWMTREDRLREIEDYVDYLEALYGHLTEGHPHGPPRRLVALGFSQGTATVARWAARTRAPLSEVVLWGGTLPPELPSEAVAERWQGVRVTLVTGTRDRWVRESALHLSAESLRAHGVAARVLTFDGGHRMDDDTLEALAASAPDSAQRPSPPRSTR